MIHISSDLNAFEDELDRIDNLPSYRAVARLEATLGEIFAETQAMVHVQTGSLRGSGKSSSDVSEGKWEGEISYGGISAGFPKSPVEYAEYEQRRGGSHDFLNVHFAEALLGESVVTVLGSD